MSRIFWGLASALLGIACTNSSTSSAPHDTSSERSNVGEADPSKLDSTCAGIFLCAADCTDSDGTCGEQCLERGTPTAQTTAIELVLCFDEAGCTDETCLRSACGDELSVCLEQSVIGLEESSSSEPPAITGEFPPELVGTWFTASTSSGMQLTFEANGEVVTVYSSETNVGCTSKLTVTSSGTATADATTLVIRRGEGTQTHVVCGGAPSTKPVEPSAVTYRYVISNDAALPILTLTSDGTTFVLRRG